MKSFRPRRFAGWQRGQDAVEFALVLPVLLLIFFGVVDLGRILHASITITNAARAGARYGSMYPDDLNAVLGVVEAEAQGSGIDLSDAALSDIAVSCPALGGCASGEPIRVEVTYEFHLILLMLFESAELPVFSYAEMRIL
jgi:hypothetical protein